MCDTEHRQRPPLYQAVFGGRRYNARQQMDELVAGFISKLDADISSRDHPLSHSRSAACSSLPPAQMLGPSSVKHGCMLILSDRKYAKQYWREIDPGWLHQEAPEINEVIDAAS